MPLVKRLVKGSPLTYAEADGNLTYLDNKVTGSVGLIPVFDSVNTVTGSNVISQLGSNIIVDGGLTIYGDLTARQYIVSSSVSHFTESFSSGSTRFGDTITDSHVFTGSVYITGSQTLDGFLSSSDGAYFSNQITVTHMTIGHGPTENNTNLTIGWQTMPVLASGLRNTVVGASSAFLLQSGSDNTVFGNGALAALISGSYNTAIGQNAGFFASGSGNVFIGHQAGNQQTSGDNKLWIANTGTLTPLIKGDFSTGLLQFNTAEGTQITGSLRVSQGINAGAIVGTSLSATTGSLSVNYNNRSNLFVDPFYKYLAYTDATDPFNQFAIWLSGSNSNSEILLQSGLQGLSIDDRLKVLSSGVQVTGSLTVSGSNTFTNIGPAVFSGSATGIVNSLIISSNTASLDLSRGNFFTLQLVGGADTYINPSNIQSGQTVCLLISTVGSGTVSFPNTVLQASGSAYVPTATTGKDIITLVSFDSSNLYLANVKNLL